MHPDDADARITWLSPNRFVVGGIEFEAALGGTTVAERYHVRKPPAMIRDYARLADDHRGGTLVELGIAQGGSTVLLSELVNPRLLIAIEQSEHPVPELMRYIEDTGSRDVIHAMFGVDQADHDTVTEILASRAQGHPVDLVIDDASHLLEPTRSSFETLFPHVRPGGTYLIEDWRWQQTLADGISAALRDPDPDTRTAAENRLGEAMRRADGTEGERDRPLLRLVFELMLACAASPDVVEEVTTSRWWVAVRRGPTQIDPSQFRLSDNYRDWHGLLSDARP